MTNVDPFRKPDKWPVGQPTDHECMQLRYNLITQADAGDNFIRRWFADVTARIEREKGK